MVCCSEAAPIPLISRTVVLVSFPRAAAGCIALVPLGFGFFGFLYTNLFVTSSTKTISYCRVKVLTGQGNETVY